MVASESPGDLGPHQRVSESADLGQDSGIVFVKSSRRDSEMRPGPGATVYEIMFAKSSLQTASVALPTLGPLPSFL